MIITISDIQTWWFSEKQTSGTNTYPIVPFIESYMLLQYTYYGNYSSKRNNVTKIKTVRNPHMYM